jgi:hypothetical protein
LRRSNRCPIERIERDHHVLLAAKVAQLELRFVFSCDCRNFKIRRHISNFERHALVSSVDFESSIVAAVSATGKVNLPAARDISLLLGANMIEISCDSCGKVRPVVESARNNGGSEWVLGYDLEVESPNALQRSMRFLDRWDDRRVLELGAIHFCSDACKEKYIAAAKAA